MTTGALPLGEPILVPLLTLVGTAICILLFDLWGVPWRLAAWVSLTSLIIAPVLALIVIVSGQGGVVQGILSGDGISALFTLSLCGAGAATVLIGLGLVEGVGRQQGGTYALVLFAISGTLIVAQAAHMLSLAMGLAILHVATGALVGPRTAWQYTILQGAGLACVLFGMSLLYAATGSMHTDMLVEELSRQTDVGVTNPLAALGLGLIIGGLTLPLGVASLHTWLASMLRETRTPGRYLVSCVLPGAAIAALGHFEQAWSEWLLALLSILGSLNIGLGYLLALRSSQIPEVLSGIVIAQSGVSTLALTAVPTTGWEVLFYVIASNGLSVTCLWAWAVGARPVDRRPLIVENIAGLGRHRPWLAGAATLGLLNLAGMPPLAGGMGQLALFRAVVAGGRGWAIFPAAIGVLLAWFMAGRWIWTMWMRPLQERTWLPVAPEIAVIALVTAGGALLAGTQAEAIMDWIANLVVNL